MPEAVGQKDTGAAMPIDQLSQLVRDLCRQHDLDRPAWKRIVAASDNHADRLEALEHQMLQTNDEVASILDGHLQSVHADASALQVQLKTTFEDMSGAIEAVERGLITSVDLVKQEFSAVSQGEKVLLQERRTKFAKVEQAVLELQSYTPEPRQPGPGATGSGAGQGAGAAGHGGAPGVGHSGGAAGHGTTGVEDQ